jgi:hypothetical protein
MGFARSWRFAGNGSLQSSVVSWQRLDFVDQNSEVGVRNSRLRAENDIAAEIVVCARAGKRKPPAVAVRDVGLRPVMTGAKVRSDHANDKSFNVKLS